MSFSWSSSPMSWGFSNVFKKVYECESVLVINRPDLEMGNKILLPNSALDQLANLKITWPMLFKIRNLKNDISTHCGVLEFVSPEGTCHIPHWIMQDLLIKPNQPIEITNVSLPKCKYVKLRPLESEFLKLSNPRAVLEIALRSFACLTVGDLIPIYYFDQVFKIEVVKLEPASATTILETDMEVEFDQFEDDEPTPPEPTPIEPTPQVQPERVIGKRLDGKLIRTKSSASSNTTDTSSANIDQPWKNRLPYGVRQYCKEYENLLKEGRIPGFIGKTRGSSNNTTNLPDNFNLFQGKFRKIT